MFINMASGLFIIINLTIIWNVNTGLSKKVNALLDDY